MEVETRRPAVTTLAGERLLTPDSLLADPPALHRDGAGDVVSYALRSDVLRFIAEHVRAGEATLETGEGVSTILFALAGCRHTCVTPNAPTVERIKTWCDEHAVSLDSVRFAVGPSQMVLPHLDPEPLDLVLIDGGHGFPMPFVDWLYTADRLRVGGHLIIDDTHLWTGEILRDFLRTERAWRMVADFRKRAVVFTKVLDEACAKEWVDQPFVLRPTMRREWVLRAGRGARMLARGDVRTFISRVNRFLAEGRAARPR